MIRPERFARLVTLAGTLIGAAREGRRIPVDEVADELNLSFEELQEDLEVLNVVNFGGGTYVLYAEIVGDEIEVDPDTYGDNFARPARLLPLEAKALVAAIDLFGDHLPEAGLGSARKKIVAALGHDPSEEGLEIAPGSDDSEIVDIVNEAIRDHRVLELHYYKENEDQFTKREVEPYQLVSGPEGWYLGCYDLARDDTRHFRLDRIKEARTWSATPSSRAPAWTSAWASRSGSPAARSAPPEWPACGSRPSGRAGWWRSARSSKSTPTARSSSRFPTGPPSGWSARSCAARATWWCSSRTTRGPRCSRRSARARNAVDAAPGFPAVTRIVASNPGPMTLEGTNTYLVDSGRGSCFVIDPGPAEAEHAKRIELAGESLGGIEGVLLTHSHGDHSQAVPLLAAPLLVGTVNVTAEGGSDPQPVEPPERIGPFEVIPTPGHAADHLVFVLGEVCFCGDLVLGHGSSFVPPDGGSLAAYMDSLAIVRELDAALMCPGHGPWITDPRAKIDEYIKHRLDRERRLLEAIDAGERSRSGLLAAAWSDVPQAMRPAAAVVMEAHLEKLAAEGALPDGIAD